MFLATRNGDVTAIVSFSFMAILTPLELGWSGNGLLNFGLSLYMLAMSAWLSWRHGIFEPIDSQDRRTWRVVARPFALLFIPIDLVWGRTVTLSIIGIVSVIFIVMDLVRIFTAKELRGIYRKGESRRFSSMTAFLVAGFLCFILFAGAMPYYALAYVTIGDLFSKLIGRKYGKTPLFRDRTLQGSLAFLAGTLLSGYTLLLLVPISLLAAGIGMITATATEIFSEPLDDNFTVPLVSGGAMFAYAFFLGI
jgi:dolichol kinase